MIIRVSSYYCYPSMSKIQAKSVDILSLGLSTWMLKSLPMRPHIFLVSSKVTKSVNKCWMFVFGGQDILIISAYPFLMITLFL